MQQSEFFSQLESSTSISRTPKDGTFAFTSIDNRAIHLDRKAYGLKRGDKEIHHILLSLPDDWNLSTVAHWLKNKEGFSLSTSYRVLARLEKAGMAPRAWHQKVRENTRQVFEVPCADRPQGADAKKRHVVKAVKACHKRYKKGNPRLPKVQGNLTGVTSAEAFSDRSGAVSNLTLLQRTKNVLHSSEHSKDTPSSPSGDRESFCDSRVKSSTDMTTRRDKPARGAKRRKGRKSPGKPHNARQMKPDNSQPRMPILTRAAINLGKHRATPDAEEFMRNLTTRLKPAIKALIELPEENTQSRIDALMANPLLSVAQEVFGYEVWTAENLRSFLNSLGERLPVNDLLLCWIGMNDCWDSHTVVEMRERLTKRAHPTAPDCRRSQIQPDLMMQTYNWARNVDDVRDSLARQCTEPVVALLAGVDLEDPETIQTHPMIWTAILASPLDPLEFFDESVVELARQTLVPVSKAVMDEWVAEQSARMSCRWNGRFCYGPLEMLVGRGICAVMQEWYEFSMVNSSGKRGPGDYQYVTNAYFAVVPHFD